MAEFIEEPYVPKTWFGKVDQLIDALDDDDTDPIAWNERGIELFGDRWDAAAPWLYVYSHGQNIVIDAHEVLKGMEP